MPAAAVPPAARIALLTLNDGRRVPRLAFGTGTALAGGDAQREVETAIEVGFRHIDTAESYGNEESVGAALAASFARGLKREDVWVTTKLKQGAKDVRAAFEQSLKKLRLDYVDLYLIHIPPTGKDGQPTPGEAWEVLERLKDEGLAKSIGVSNYAPGHFAQDGWLEKARYKPVVNQIEHHPYVAKFDGPLLDLQKKYNIHVEVYAPLVALTRARNLGVEPVVSSIASAKRGRTEGSVLLKWAYQRTGGVVVTTSGKRERLEEYVKAFSDGPGPDGGGDGGPADVLSEEELKRIEEEGTKGGKVYFRKYWKEMIETAS